MTGNGSSQASVAESSAAFPPATGQHAQVSHLHLRSRTITFGVTEISNALTIKRPPKGHNRPWMVAISSFGNETVLSRGCLPSCPASRAVSCMDGCDGRVAQRGRISSSFNADCSASSHRNVSREPVQVGAPTRTGRPPAIRHQLNIAPRRAPSIRAKAATKVKFLFQGP